MVCWIGTNSTVNGLRPRIGAPVALIVMLLERRSMTELKTFSVSMACGLCSSQGSVIMNLKKPSSEPALKGSRRKKLSSPRRSSIPSNKGVPLSIQRRLQSNCSQVLAILVVVDRISCISSCSSKRRDIMREPLQPKTIPQKCAAPKTPRTKTTRPQRSSFRILATEGCSNAL